MKTKMLGILSILLGVFLFAGAAMAADADMLQPASDVVYNENVDINGSLNVDSLRVGTAGLGGVTFFNGTVLNEGAEPFTVGDDFRVDGEIFRIQKGGDPIKISDNVIPTLDGYNGFGDSSHRWNSIYTNALNAQELKTLTTHANWHDSINFRIFKDDPDKDDFDIRDRIGTIKGDHNDSDVKFIAHEGNIKIGAEKSGKVIINLKTRFMLEPYDGSSYTCNNSHYGEMVFSSTDLGSGANEFYGCTASGWRRL